MLKEGKSRQRTEYIVCWKLFFGQHETRVFAHSAQEAADFIRLNDPEIKIIEVAKVVNNWK